MISLRVISGKYKGKNIKGYDIEGTRPTMDRVKESVFSTIQNYIPDSVVLDLFSGSGNFGIEAISNGSKTCYFVDNNKIAVNTIKDNTKTINEEYHILNLDYKDALNKFDRDNIKFDLIFLDPPYKFNYIDSIIEFVLEKELLNKDGLIICEIENDINTLYDDLDLYRDKKYGNKKVIIFKKK